MILSALLVGTSTLGFPFMSRTVPDGRVRWVLVSMVARGNMAEIALKSSAERRITNMVPSVL